MADSGFIERKGLEEWTPLTHFPVIMNNLRMFTWLAYTKAYTAG